MGFLINPYNFAAAGVGGWVELGRTTLGSANSNITVSSLANKRYYMYLADIKGQSSNADGALRYNSDPTLNYANRGSDVGNTDAITVNQNQIQVASHTGSMSTAFDLGYIANLSTKEKLNQSWSVSTGSGGAGAAPYRWEGVGKWGNISDSINTINFKTSSSQTWNTGSEVIVLGYDPADTHTNNFWTELASVDLSGGLIDTGVFTAKKYLWIQGYCITGTVSGGFQGMFVGNGIVDKTTSYALRYSVDGGADGTSINQSVNGPFALTGQGGANSNDVSFFNIFVINNASNEKLFIGHNTFGNKTGGAGVVNDRTECVAKWTNINNQINRISVEYVGTGSLTAGTLKVWGSD